MDPKLIASGSDDAKGMFMRIKYIGNVKTRGDPVVIHRAVYNLNIMFPLRSRERSGSMVECLPRDPRAAGSSLIGITALCP